MTDRYNALVVVLEHNTRDDDAEATINAIKQIKGVISVKGNVSDINDHIAKECARLELSKNCGKYCIQRKNSMRDTTGDCEHGVPYREVCEACREETLQKCTIPVINDYPICITLNGQSAYVKLVDGVLVHGGDLPTTEAVRVFLEGVSEPYRQVANLEDIVKTLLARLQYAVDSYGGLRQPPGGIITKTTNERGDIIAIARVVGEGPEKGRVLETIWRKQ